MLVKYNGENFFSGSEREPPKKSDNYVRRKNLLILFNNTTLIPFKWRGKYLCFYCGNEVGSYKRLRKHTYNHGLCTDTDKAIRLVKSIDSEIKIDVSYIKCKLCFQSFLNLDNMVDHLISTHDLSFNKDAKLTITTYRLLDLQCLLCDEQFDYFQKLVSHMNTSHPNNSFLCTECDQIFNKMRDLRTHMRNYHKQENTCVTCNATFNSHVALRFHRLHSHPSNCYVCFQTFSSEMKRINHMKNEHIGDQVECGHCKEVLPNTNAVLRHGSKCTAKKDPTLETIVVDDEEKKVATKDLRNSIATIINMSTAIPFKFFIKFRCFYCSKDFSNCDGLKEHTVMQHPQCNVGDKCMKLRNRHDGNKIKIDIASLSCKLCYEPLLDLNTLIEHLTTEHKVQFNKAVESHLQTFKLIKNNYSCPQCDEVFRYFTVLLKHMSKSHTGNKYICVFCGQSFRTYPNLRSHVKRRHKVSTTTYECNNCGLIFTSCASLKQHLGKDHDVKMFKCIDCQDKFSTQYWLLRHMLVVHGEGYKCTYCDKAFIKNSFLVNHVRRLHLKERNVKCKVCSEKFFDRQRLKMHMVKHVGERNFHCDICSKRFLWKRNLKAHIASHARNANAQTGIT